MRSESRAVGADCLKINCENYLDFHLQAIETAIKPILPCGSASQYAVNSLGRLVSLARKIGVLGINQTTGSPRTFVKKAVAELMVRRLVAEWASTHVIRLRAVKSASAHLQTPKRYIPAELPHAELPGIIFDHENTANVRSMARMAADWCRGQA